MAAGDKLLLQSNRRKKIHQWRTRRGAGDSGRFRGAGRWPGDSCKITARSRTATPSRHTPPRARPWMKCWSSRRRVRCRRQSAAILRQHLARARRCRVSPMMSRCCARMSPVPARGWRPWKWSRLSIRRKFILTRFATRPSLPETVPPAPDCNNHFTRQSQPTNRKHPVMNTNEPPTQRNRCLTRVTILLTARIPNGRHSERGGRRRQSYHLPYAQLLYAEMIPNPALEKNAGCTARKAVDLFCRGRSHGAGEWTPCRRAEDSEV